MSTASTIQASLDSLDAEIEKLTKARGELVALLDDDVDAEEETPKRSRSKSSGSKSTSRRARVTEDEDEDEKPARRSRSGGKRDAERKASSRKASSNGAKEGGTRKDQIAAMLEDDMSPREIADELGIATNYVYNVKRQLA